jgi:hypothetical protein
VLAHQWSAATIGPVADGGTLAVFDHPAGGIAWWGAAQTLEPAHVSVRLHEPE